MAENQYIVETKFTADTEEFKEGVKEVEQGLNDLEGALNEMGNDATSAKIGEATEKLGELKGAAEKAKPAVEAAGKGLGEMAAGATTAGAGALTAGAALSALAGMFLGLIPIVVSAGRAIYKWGKTALEAIRESLQMSLRVAEANNAIEQSGVAAAAAVTKFKLLADAWKNLTPEDKVKEFDNYQKALKKLGIAVTNINDADRVFINQSNDVISALVARARAAGAEKLIAEAEEKKMLAQIERDKLQNRLDTYQNASDFLGSGGRSEASGYSLAAYDAYDKKQLQDRIAGIDKEISKQDTFINRITETYKKAASGAKTLGEFASEAAEEVVEEGSIDALTNQLKNLETQFNATGDATKRAELGEQIKNVKDQIAELKGETKEEKTPLNAIKEDVPPVVGSLDELNEALKKARENYDSAATQEMRQFYATQIDRIEQSIDVINKQTEAYLHQQGVLKAREIGATANMSVTAVIGENYKMSPLDPSTSPIAKRLNEQQQTVYEATLALQEHVERYNETLSSMFGDSIVASVSDGVQALSDAVMGIGDIDASGVVAAFLQPFAQMAVSMGETLIASGIGAISLKKLLTNPWTAIAAGTALVALGSIASSAIQKHLNTATGGGGSAGSPNDWVGGGALLATNSAPIQVEVYGTLSGQDIVLAGNNYTNNQRR